MPADQAQRSEQPTPRRKQKAREEGQVASSREFTSALQFAAAVALVVIYGGDVLDGLRLAMRGLFAYAYRPSLTLEEILNLFITVAAEPMSFLAVFAGVLLTIGLLTQLAQTGFALSPKRLQPDFKRLNPGPKITQLPGDNLAQTLKALILSLSRESSFGGCCPRNSAAYSNSPRCLSPPVCLSWETYSASCLSKPPSSFCFSAPSTSTDSVARRSRS